MMHLPTLAERPDLFQIVALADTNKETLDAVGERYKVARRHLDYRTLLEDTEVEAVLLLASGSHVAPAIHTLESKKHLFVEKPLAFTQREIESIAAARPKGPGTPVLMVGVHKRYDPAVAKAKELVGKLGSLRYVQVTVLHPDDGAYRTHHAVLPIPAAPKAKEPEAAGDARTAHEVTQGGSARAIAEIAGADAPVDARVAAFIATTSLIHDINLVRGILGEPEAVVSAHVWRGGLAQSSVTRFANDVHVNMSWVSVPALQNYEESVRFVGNECRVSLVFPSPYLRHFPTVLEVERMDGEHLVVERHTATYEEAFRVELYHFRDCVLGGKAPATGIDDALGDARWIQQLSAATRRGS
jgi:predicted dehydrogenase